MRAPALADGAFLADVAASRADGLTLWWLGQSGFLVRCEGAFALLDPYLSDSLTAKYAASDRRHVRMTGRVVDAARLDMIEVVTASHGHTDHLDADTLRPVLAASPRAGLVAPSSLRALAADRAGIAPAAVVGLDDGETVETGGFDVTGIAAAHEQVDRDEQGRCRYLGFVIRRSGWTIYHAGDTVLHPGLVASLAATRPDVALLPINGRAAGGLAAGNLDGREAAELALAIGARLAIPCHYDMFTFNTAPPDEFAATADRIGQPYRILHAGARLECTPRHDDRRGRQL